MTPSPEDHNGWTPIRVAWRGAEPVVVWCYTDGVAFTDPFFDQTVERCLAEPFRLLFQQETSIDSVAQLAASLPSPAPSGFVMHWSRCGSTLVSRLLAQLRGVSVMAEPSPLDSILSARVNHPEISEDVQVDWFRWMVAALGHNRGAGDDYVVKLDAWATLWLPVIRRAYPDVPWTFVYRDPVEVLVSQLSVRGLHMIPGYLAPELFELTIQDVQSMVPEEYMALVLGRLAAPVLAGPDRPLLVNYRELPEAVGERIAPHFRLAVDPGQRAGLSEAAGRNAKNSFLPFVDDSADKQRRATAELRASADRWCQPAYAALETARRAVP